MQIFVKSLNASLPWRFYQLIRWLMGLRYSRKIGLYLKNFYLTLSWPIYYIGPERGRGSIKRKVDPIFNIKIWNVFDRVAEEQARTNNAIEGFNSAIQKTLSCQHPTIWKLISSLKKEAVMAKKELIYEEQGYWSNKRKRHVRIEDNIKKLRV